MTKPKVHVFTFGNLHTAKMFASILQSEEIPHTRVLNGQEKKIAVEVALRHLPAASRAVQSWYDRMDEMFDSIVESLK